MLYSKYRKKMKNKFYKTFIKNTQYSNNEEQRILRLINENLIIN